MLSDEELNTILRDYSPAPAKIIAVFAQAKLGNALKDAERYRWIRERPSLIDWDNWVRPVLIYESISPDFLDREIDAAMQAEKEKA